MGKLVQYVEWNFPNIMPNKMYCYGEANFEANQAMQEPLEKLYKYENLPNMRDKIKEYISELNVEIMRCMEWQTENIDMAGSLEFEKYITRIETLQEVRNDLKGRLEELI